MSPDLRAATAYVTPLGGGDIGGVLAALNRAAPFLRGQVARRVRLRSMPKLQFEADGSFDYAARIGSLLDRPAVARDLEYDESPPAHPPPGHAEGA